MNELENKIDNILHELNKMITTFNLIKNDIEKLKTEHKQTKNISSLYGMFTPNLFKWK